MTRSARAPRSRPAVVRAATRSPGARPRHAVAHGEHRARELEAGGEGHRGPLLVPALAHQDVGEVEARPPRPRSRPRPARARDRGRVTHREHVGGVAVRGHRPGLHGLTTTLLGPTIAREGPSRLDLSLALGARSAPDALHCHHRFTVHRSRGPVRTYTPKPADIHRAWHVVDADGAVLGRLASQVANAAAGQAQADLLAAHGHRRPRDRDQRVQARPQRPQALRQALPPPLRATRAGSRRRPSSTCSRVTPSGSSASPSRACSRRGASAAA